MKLQSRGSADGSDSDEDDEPYNYANPQPIDVSFSNPEVYDNDGNDEGADSITKRTKSLPRGKFIGPKVKYQGTLNKTPHPTPPPRPLGYEITKIRTNSSIDYVGDAGSSDGKTFFRSLKDGESS